MYDYVIIGGGPSGLTLAWYLSKRGKKCVIIEREGSLGGCHRVTRQDGLFTEHGPRIYTDASINFIHLLQEMGMKWDGLFVKSQKQVVLENLNKLRGSFSFNEYEALAVAYFKINIDQNYGKHMSVLQFANEHVFSEPSIRRMRYFCMLTDGVDIDRYTMFEFLQIIKQQSLYGIFATRVPNDVGLVKLWEDKLKEVGVKILLKTEVKTIVDEHTVVTTGNEKIHGNVVILACPPVQCWNIIKKSFDPDMFGNLFRTFALDTNYNTYISVSFVFDHDLPKLNNDITPWGTIAVPVPDGKSSKVLSTFIYDLNKVSPVTHKTANETTNVDDITNEMLRQITVLNPWLANYEPVSVTLNPQCSYNKKDRCWVTTDTAYARVYNHNSWKFTSSYLSIYCCGTHNGRSTYNITSIETAVCNAKYLSDTLLGKVPDLYITPSRFFI